MKLAAVLLAYALAASVIRSQAVAQVPPRDQGRVALTGTASLAGAVVADDETKRPLRQVRVTLSRRGVEDNRITTTDDDGRYQFDLLPGAAYSLNFSKGGYIDIEYGAPKPGQFGHSIAITDGQTLTAEPVALLRGAVIAGRITDRFGRPVGDVPVFATQFVDVNGVRTNRISLGTSSDSFTNAHGDYRLYGLLPGAYIIYAGRTDTQVPDPISEAEIRWAERPTGQAPPRSRPAQLAPTLFPGTTNPDATQPVVLGRGEERLGVDFALQSVLMAQVSGVLVDASGRPAASSPVTRSPKRVVPFTTMELTTVRTDAAGVFTFTNVPPGDYVLTARGGQASVIVGDGTSRAIQPAWAMMDLTVNGQDINRLQLALQPGLTIRGRVIVSGATPAWPLGSIRIALSRTSAVPGPSSGTASAVGTDGSFSIEGLMAGSYRAHVTVPATAGPEWRTRSAVMNGRDLLDEPFEITAAAGMSELVVTVTDSGPRLTGHLTDDAGRPASQLYVIAFSTNPAAWWSGSRRIQSVKTLDDGGYTLGGLPAGEYYVCALSEENRQLMFAAEYLTQLIDASIKVTLADGQQQTQDLRIRRSSD